MRGLRLGLGLSRGRSGDPDAFGLTITGTSTDSIGTYAQVGNHASIGYTETPTSGTETVKWSNSSNPADAATYGAGASPTDFTAGDGGTLWLHVTDGGETVSRSAAIRYAPGTFGALSNQSFVENTGNQTYVFSAATGTGLTWTYSLVSPPAGVTIVSATRTITYDTDALAVQAGTSITVRATDQYGRTADQTTDLTITATPTVTIAGLTDGEALEGTHASITVSATPGAVTARRWGTSSGANDLGTGTNPSDFTNSFPGTLYAGVQISGVWFETSATISTNDFVFTVETTSASESFTLPMRNAGTYNGTVVWGDGSTGTITAYNDADLTNTYASAGMYRVRCRGSWGSPLFNGAADRAKVITIENLGTIWTNGNFSQSFRGMTGLTTFAAGRTDMSSVTTMFACFKGNTALLSVDWGNATFEALQSIVQICADCTALNTFDLPAMSAAPLQDANEAFFNAHNVSGLDPSSLNIRSITGDGTPYNYAGGFFNFLDNVNLSTAITDATYIAWDAQLPIIAPFDVEAGHGVIVDFQSSTGTAASTAARRRLVQAGFYIEDGNSAVPETMSAPSLTVLSSTSIQVDWTRPYSDLPVSSYAIDYSSNGGSSWTTVSGISNAVRTYNLTGLTASTAYLVRVRATSFIGNGAWSSTNSATTSSGATPRTLTSVTVSNVTSSSVDVTLTGVDVLASDTFYWVAYDSLLGAPTNTQVFNGQDTNGAAADASGSDTGSLSFTEITALADGDYKLAIIADNGALSNVVVSATFTVSTISGSLELEGDASGNLDLEGDAAPGTLELEGA